MSENIVLSATITIPNGPKLSINRTLTLDAYDKIDVTVAAGAADKRVDLQPGASGQVQFLLVASNQYGGTLTYKVNSSSSTAVYKLDQPHLLTGVGAVGMLDPAPASLFFSNGLAQDAQIQILIGRDATP